MKNLKRISISFILTVMILVSNITPTMANVNGGLLEATINETAKYMYTAVKNPQVGSVGGEWAVISLARSKYDVPKEYYQTYYETVKKYVKDRNGILHDKRYTDYSRVILALTAIGKDPTNVAGYNLLLPLGDYEKTVWQGLNGPIWALIALDSNNYEIPKNQAAKTQATRQLYIDHILESQIPDGGWSLLGSQAEASDPDITGMVLQALAKYQDQEAVKKATNEALAIMSKVQNAKGGYSSFNLENSESTIQMILALTELGISLDDPRFVKNNNNLLDNLMTFNRKDNGFLHTLTEGDKSSQMASEMALCALVATLRSKEGSSSLYTMTDIVNTLPDIKPTIGLLGKHKDITHIPIVEVGRTFADISGVNAHQNQVAIEALASRKIINGKAENIFAPDETVTRAEFATIIINSLGLKPAPNNKFKDVPVSAWYAPYVGAANSYGIVGGTSATEFNPNGIITKQEAAIMITRAAKLSGLDTQMDDQAVRDILAQFSDYVKSAQWAHPSLAFVYKENILDQSDLNISATSPMSRGEIAQMVYNMLDLANLL